MDPKFTLLHLLCAVAALVATALLSTPERQPAARPWLAGALFVLGLGELYFAAVCIGLTLRWPALNALGLVWLALPVLLWKHVSRGTRRARHPLTYWRVRQA